MTKQPISAVNLAARVRAQELYQAHSGRISTDELVKQLAKEGFQTFTTATLLNWKRSGDWDRGITPTLTRALQRLTKAKDLREIISAAGGEHVMLETLYGDMLMGSGMVMDKLVAWSNLINPKKLTPEQAIDLMKVLPGFIDRAVKLRATMADLRFKGAAHRLTDAGSDPDALDGEIMPPERQEGHDAEDKKDRKDKENTGPNRDQAKNDAPLFVPPQLNDALIAIARAKRDAPNLVKDKAPKARNTTK
jgi:hypothetical protein